MNTVAGMANGGERMVMTSSVDRISALDESDLANGDRDAAAQSRSVGTGAPAEPLRSLRAVSFAGKETQDCAQLSFVEGWRKAITARRGEKSSDRDASAAERITVWTAPVRRLVRAHYNLLGPEDLLAVSQMRSAANRDCTIAGRVLLRVALSQTVDNQIEPRKWRINVGGNGKPVVAAGYPPLHFSIAHTDQIVIVAVSRTLPMGIDVETVDEGPSRDLIATCCYPSERLLFNATAPYELAHEFTRLWTLKEAYAKMIGVGHELDFATFGVSLERLHVLPDAPYREHYDPHFETMWISHGSALSHLSLAIGFPETSARNVDLAIMTLKADDEGQSAFAVPGVNVT